MKWLIEKLHTAEAMLITGNLYGAIMEYLEVFLVVYLLAAAGSFVAATFLGFML